MILYFDYDPNYYCRVKPTTGIVYQLLSKGPPYYRTSGPENGNMAAELLVAQDTYGYSFDLVNKERVNESKTAPAKRDSFIQTMAAIYNETESELAVSKNLYETISGGLYFKQLIHLDCGFTINADIRAYDPQDKRLTLAPKGGLCVTDITISKITTISKNLIKRVGPIGVESYYLAYRQPLSGNVVIALPDGESYLYVSLSGTGSISDDELYEFMLTVLTVDYTGSLALMDS